MRREPIYIINSFETRSSNIDKQLSYRRVLVRENEGEIICVHERGIEEENERGGGMSRKRVNENEVWGRKSMNGEREREVKRMERGRKSEKGKENEKREKE